MVICSVSKIEKKIHERSISIGAYLFYFFISIGSINGIFAGINNIRTEKFSLFLDVISILTNALVIVKLIICYFIAKGYSVADFAYAAIPLYAIVYIKYLLFFLFPFVLFSLLLSYNMKINIYGEYALIIGILYLTFSFIIMVSFIFAVNRIVEEEKQKL